MKILIWDEFEIVNSGGPSGYLYNLREYLKNNPSNHIVFLSDIKESIRVFYPETPQLGVSPQSQNRNIIQKTYSLLNGSNNIIIKKIISLYHQLKWKFVSYKYHIQSSIEKIRFFTKKQFTVPYNEKLDINSLNQFDYIHFHIVVQFSRFKTTYPNCKSKTILTSHCPCPYIDEQLCIEKKWMRLFRQLALNSECNAYRSCNYLMFPCREAMEPYIKVRKIRKTMADKRDNIFFVPTAILDYQTKCDWKDLRTKNGIPLNNFVITFFGRHCHIKGYDILKSVGIDFLNKHKECTIVCAGKGEIESPKHERWIELGFINNVNDYLSISDLHIIPNRDTYFDIAMLEVMRAGKNIIVSRTGGNKYFLKFPEQERPAIHFFNFKKHDELYKLMEASFLKKQKNNILYKDEGYKNRTLFLKYFSLEDYYHNYIRIIESLTPAKVC